MTRTELTCPEEAKARVGMIQKVRDSLARKNAPTSGEKRGWKLSNIDFPPNADQTPSGPMHCWAHVGT